MFNDAINDGLHPGPNPFANLRLEQSRGRKDLIALTVDELDELAEHGAWRAWRVRAGVPGDDPLRRVRRAATG